MDGVRTAKGGEGVTGAMIRARLWVEGKLAAVCRRFWGRRWRPTVAVVKEIVPRQLFLPVLRQLFFPVHLLFLAPLLGRIGTKAGHIEFQDDGMVNHPVDGGSGGHGVGEDVLPLGEDQVGGDAQGAAFVAFGD